MKKLVSLFVLSAFISPVFADNLFQNSNPFPNTSPQHMNNIYESEPAIIQHEEKQVKKSWFKKGKNLQEQEAKDANLKTYPVHEGAQDSNSFYMFK